MVSPAKKPTVNLDPTLREGIEKLAASTFYHSGRHPMCDDLEKAVDVFLNGRVASADIVMFDRTPMVRAVIRHQGKAHRVDKTRPLLSLIPVKPDSQGDIINELHDDLLLLLPQDLVAMKMADIENASAAALQDPKKTEPIHKRLAARRAADKEKLLARIREVFKGHDDLVSRDEILQLWDETFVAEVMES